MCSFSFAESHSWLGWRRLPKAAICYECPPPPGESHSWLWWRRLPKAAICYECPPPPGDEPQPPPLVPESLVESQHYWFLPARSDPLGRRLGRGVCSRWARCLAPLQASRSMTVATSGGSEPPCVRMREICSPIARVLWPVLRACLAPGCMRQAGLPSGSRRPTLKQKPAALSVAEAGPQEQVAQARVQAREAAGEQSREGGH